MLLDIFDAFEFVLAYPFLSLLFSCIICLESSLVCMMSPIVILEELRFSVQREMGEIQ